MKGQEEVTRTAFTYQNIKPKQCHMPGETAEIIATIKHFTLARMVIPVTSLFNWCV
jgi:hypothetical protein